MADHPTGNPDLIQQHKAIQRQGDQELKGGETKGKEAPGLEDDALPEERSAGVVQPHDGSRTRLPSMKPATEPEIEGEAGGEAFTDAGANPGP